MAYSNYYDNLPDDLANINLSADNGELLTSEDFSGLLNSLSQGQLDSRDLDLLGYSTNDNNYLDTYDSGYNHPNTSPYHEYTDNTLYPEETYSNPSLSPYNMPEDSYGSLPPTEASTPLYADYQMSPVSEHGSNMYQDYQVSPQQDRAKPKQKRDRKTKEFYDSLTKEQKKQREKEKCKLRVQKFREREREKNMLIASALETEEQRKAILQAKLAKLQTEVPEHYRRIMQIIKKSKNQRST